MNYSRPAVGVCALIMLAGCTSKPEAETKAKTPWGKPAHIRVVNLTSGEIDAKVGNLYTDTLSPSTMSGATPVSPGKKHKVQITAKGKAEVFEASTEPGQFSTVVVSDSGIKSFVSGQSLSRREGGAIDFINLTQKSLKFDAAGVPVEVPSMNSTSMEFANGSVDVKAGSSNTIKATLSDGQIWGIYAYETKGKLQLGGLTLKGTGQAAAAGGPSAN